MTPTNLDHLLAAIIRMEDKARRATMTGDEYWATVALAQECGAPTFIAEYFARKASELDPRSQS